MSYHKRIITLQESLKLLETRIKSLTKDSDDLLLDAIRQKTTLEREISRLQRIQWEEDHERIDLDE